MTKSTGNRFSRAAQTLIGATEEKQEIVTEEKVAIEEPVLKETSEAAHRAVSVVETVQERYSKLVKEQVRPKRKIKAWEIVLLILGFPIWGSLLISAAAVVFAVYICIWAAVICLYAADLALGASAFAMLTCSVVFFVLRSPIAALWMLAAALVLAGFTILFFLLSNLCTKGAAILGKKIGIAFKKMLIAKERAK